MNEARDFDALREVGSERLSRMAAAPSHAQLTNTLS